MVTSSSMALLNKIHDAQLDKTEDSGEEQDMHKWKKASYLTSNQGTPIIEFTMCSKPIKGDVIMCFRSNDIK
jgi:hypothetical protein